MVSLHKTKRYFQSAVCRTEQGRSLTEMLGVLAIVGVLSIAAILGYQFAINKYRANETINQLNQYALIAAAQAQQKQTSFDLSELGPITHQGYPIVGMLAQDPAYFELALSNVPPATCKQILKSGWKQPLVLMANERAYSGNADICETNDDTLATMKFQFDIYLDAGALPLGACRDSSDCSAGCTACVAGQCESICTGDQRCATDTQSGAQVCCPSDKRAGPMCCAIKHNGMCCNNYGQCCPWYKPLADTNGACYACDTNVAIDVKGKLGNCAICPTREISGTNCVPSCPKDKPVRDRSGSCHACDERDPFVAPATCSQCPNRVLGGQSKAYCSLPCGEGIHADRPLMESYGRCHACDEKNAVRVYDVGQNCAICPNRQLTGYMCVIPCTDPEKPLPSYEGTCLSCDDSRPAHVLSSKVTCDMCPNRKMHGDFCILPCSEGENKDKPLLLSNGTCRSCEDKGQIITTKASCDVCPNRVYIGMLCMLPCPKDKPLPNYLNNCYACDEPLPVNMAEGRADCSKICPNRRQEGLSAQHCALPCGYGIYEDEPLVGSNGRCYSCEDPAPVYILGVLDNCRACPNRKLEGTSCVLK